MSRRGIWKSPTEFQSFAAIDKVGSLSSEIATRQRSIDFYTLGMYLPNPDTLLKKLGKDITVYKELRADGHVQGCITSRKAGTKKLLWDIDRGKSQSRQAKYISDAVKALPVHRIINQILNAPLYGYQVMEVMWDPKTWTPSDVVGKPQQWFVFNEDNELRFRTKDNWNGIQLPEKKFLVASHDADYENPYGFPLLSCCFWPVTFRKGGYKFWVTFTEKFGMPFIVGKLPRGADKAQRDEFADTLEAMVQDAIAVIPDDGSVEIPETKNTGSADLYDKLISACKNEISIALLGHTGSSQSTPGKLGGEDQAGDVRDDIIGDDKRIVEDTFNQLIKWISFYNFSERTELPEFILYEEEDVDKTLSERDEKLTTALDKSNLRLSKKYYQKGYALDDEDLEEKPVEPVQSLGLGVRSGLPGQMPGEPAQFSAAVKSVRSQEFGVRRGLLRALKNFFNFSKPTGFEDQQAIDQAVEKLSPADLQKQMEGVLKPVIELIQKGTSPEDVMKDLVKAYPDMDTKAIEQMLARAIFVSECWGRLKAEGKYL